MGDHNIGILHPGAMGVSIAAAAQAAGHTCLWLPEGRGEATRERAEEHGLMPAGSLDDIVACPVILSVCPPHAAKEVAATVANAGFDGLYMDGNAVSPMTARQVAATVEAAGARYVDGGIVGPPAWQPGTCLYLSGPAAVDIAALFEGSVLEAQVLDDGVDTASALKMVYAARTKGTTALLAAVMAAAENLGVRGALETRLAAEDAALPGGIARSIETAAPKAWRWIAEMEEIAATLRAAGTEGGFHDAAAALWRQLDSFKDSDGARLDDILATLGGSGRKKAAE
jgi:3-hydroxyisobutyrate dehydrogenase-like beta-hydroxyacid dehydrogenase